MKKLLTISLLFVLSLFFYLLSFSKAGEPKHLLQQWKATTLTWYQQQATDFLQQLQRLRKQETSFTLFVKQFQRVRYSLKKMEGLLAFFDERQYMNLNSRLRPDLELEKGTYEHVEEPHGLQVIESFLEDSLTCQKAKPQLQDEMDRAIRVATFLQQHPFTKPYADTALAESVSRQLLRLAAMGTTGFDKPVLEDAITETVVSLQGIHDLLLHLPSSTVEVIQLRQKVQLCLTYPDRRSKNFSSFNRLLFIRNYLQPAFVAAQQWKAAIGPFVSPVYQSFFSPAYINQVYHYNPLVYPVEMIDLGKKLFNSTIMSSNQRISCASCHKADLAFADTVKLNAGFELTDTLQRNTPSLLNVAYHLRFQRDGHLLFLQDQFREVIFNHTEMGNISEGTLLHRIHKTDSLKTAFLTIFPKASDSITIAMPLQALEAYVHSLVNTQSVFDKYMTGETVSISPAVARGFNLFMGDAKCGTCHFMPVFNGVQPPFFTKEDNEVIGVLRNDNFNRPVLDKDSGLAVFTHSELHQSSFKVPSVRHLVNTFPYMHNGSLKTLDKLLLFYNMGGGGGWMMGAEVPNQTLDREPLKLDEKQRADIKAFLQSLN